MITESQENQEIQTTPLLPNNNKETPKRSSKYTDDVSSHILSFQTTLGKEMKSRSSHPEVFLEKGLLKICTKFIGEHPCQSVISIKQFY